jgi:hypothetical protein
MVLLRQPEVNRLDMRLLRISVARNFLEQTPSPQNGGEGFD